MTPEQIDQAAQQIIDTNPDVVGAFVAVKHKDEHIEIRRLNLSDQNISFLTDLAKAESIKKWQRP